MVGQIPTFSARGGSARRLYGRPKRCAGSPCETAWLRMGPNRRTSRRAELWFATLDSIVAGVCSRPKVRAGRRCGLLLSLHSGASVLLQLGIVGAQWRRLCSATECASNGAAVGSLPRPLRARRGLCGLPQLGCASVRDGSLRGTLRRAASLSAPCRPRRGSRSPSGVPSAPCSSRRSARTTHRRRPAASSSGGTARLPRAAAGRSA